jgi:spermidine synthase
MILLLFFCSGATALVYEVLWSKYLALLLGSTIQAQTVVLAAFMGGLALGNKLFSRHADQSSRPLSTYGKIEATIGIYGALFPFIYKLADTIFVSVGSKLLEHSGWLLLLKGFLSAALLLGPTILMGGTLPMLAAWLQKQSMDPGRRSARFYSVNSLGAVCGAGLTGFLLVEWLGLEGTMEAAAVVNIVIGLIAWQIGKSPLKQAANDSENPVSKFVSSSAPMASTIAFRWGCVLVAVTGAVSMGLEVLASRCLGLIFGSSLQVFAIVLMAFILGIGFGSAIIASPRRKSWPKEIATIILLLAAAIMIGVVVFNIENLVRVYMLGRGGLSQSLVGYRYHQILVALLSICVLGLPAATLGSVLPLWIRISENSGLLGDRVGRLLTWNTLGAVFGVLLTGFVLMPEIGLRGSFTALAIVLVAGALLIALVTRRRLASVAAVVIGIFTIMISLTGDEQWRNILSSGIFRMAGTDVSMNAFFEERRKEVKLLFYEDAADATVSVESQKLPFVDREVVLRINGKPDASAVGDAPTQLMLSNLPLMAKPDSKDVFCFGMGSGITAGSTLGYPIEHLTIAENCEPVLRAVKLFEPWNHGVFTNDRVHIYREDARTVLKLSPQKYDIIISEPSNPWMVGIGSVFSREFYQVAANRLKPGGLMTQWFHIYEMDDATMNLVLRTFASVFPNMEIWDVGDEDVVLLGSNQPWKTGPDVYRRAFELDGPHRDLASIGILSPETVLSRQLASQHTAFALPGPGPVQRDDFPILEYEAPRAFYMFHGRRGVAQLQSYDERTWQVGIAPLEKNEELAKLDFASLNPIFGKAYGSGNPELQSYLDNCFAGRVGSMSFGNRIMPCIFQTPGSKVVIYAPQSAKTNETSRQLYYAEAYLQSDPTNVMRSIDSIRKILDTLHTSKPEELDWSPSHYADLAIKASLRLGDTVAAKSILKLGLEIEPGSPQLAYLSRILNREGVLQSPESGSSSAKENSP